MYIKKFFIDKSATNISQRFFFFARHSAECRAPFTAPYLSWGKTTTYKPTLRRVMVNQFLHKGQRFPAIKRIPICQLQLRQNP